MDSVKRIRKVFFYGKSKGIIKTYFYSTTEKGAAGYDIITVTLCNYRGGFPFDESGWEDQKTFVCTVGTLAQTAKENNITKTALMIIGDVVAHSHYDRSELYNPAFTTEFREATK